MKRLVLVLIAFVLAVKVAAVTKPAPKTQQLNLCLPSYGGSSFWDNTYSPLRTWYAEHCNLVPGSGSTVVAAMTTMKNVNPQLKGISYDIFLLSASDTLPNGPIRTWCASKSPAVDPERFWYRTLAGQTVVIDGVGDGPTNDQGFGHRATTTPTSILIQGGFYSSTSGIQQYRTVVDFRDTIYGQYLYELWNAASTANNNDGVVVDEEGIMGITGRNGVSSGPFPIAFVARESGTLLTDTWIQGSPYTSLNRPWGNNFDCQDANTTHGTNDLRDSTFNLRASWQGLIGRKMRDAGKLVMPNFAGLPSNRDNHGDWLEVKAIAKHYGGIITSELNNNAALAVGNLEKMGSIIRSNYEIANETMADGRAIHYVCGWGLLTRDSLKLYDGYANPGALALADGMTWERQKLAWVGANLVSLPRGSVKFYFMPAAWAGQTEWYHSRKWGRGSRSYGSGETGWIGASQDIGIFHDSTLLSACMLKWFGEPEAGVDSVTGGFAGITGANGRPGRLWVKKFYRELANTNLQTLVLGRFYDNQTNMQSPQYSKVFYTDPQAHPWNTRYVYTLPSYSASAGDQYFELNENGTYKAAKVEGDTVAVGNAMFRIFVTNTSIANSGLGTSAELVSIAVDSLFNDVAGEQDSVQFTYVTAPDPAPDTTVVLWSTSGFRDESERMSTTNAFRVVHNANTTVTQKFVTSQAEPWTLYLSSWTYDKELPGWSNLKTASRTFNPASIASISATATLNEGNSGPQTANVQVTFSAPQGTNKNFRITTADGSATSGTGDYVAQSNVLYTMTAGQTSRSIPIVINGDGATEGDETFTVTLSSLDSPLILGNAVCTVTIINDDAGAPSIANRGVKMVKVKAVKVEVK